MNDPLGIIMCGKVHSVYNGFRDSTTYMYNVDVHNLKPAHFMQISYDYSDRPKLSHTVKPV